MYNYKQSNSRFQYILRKMCKKLSIFAFYIKTPRFIFCTLVMCDKCKIWCQIRMKHPAKKSKKTALVYKNKKQKRKNRASSGKPAVRAAGSLSSGQIKNDFLPISCRHPYHRRKKEKFDFPTSPPGILTTGTEKKSLFSRLPPPGVLSHRREKINLDFSASPSGHPSRRRRKAELIFPASPVCRPSFRCRKAKLVFPVFPSVILTTDTEKQSLFSRFSPSGVLRAGAEKQSLFFRFSPLLAFASAARYLFPCSSLALPFSQTRILHRQPFSITNPLRACLPRLSPAPKKVCRQPFPLSLPSLLFRPSLLFPQSPNGFMPCPSPAPACFFPNFSQTMDFDKKNRAPQDAIFLLLFKFVQFN